MGLKRGKFLIARSDTWDRRYRSYVKGYIDEENNIGYDHRWKDEWFATDIETGCKIASGEKLKDCQKSVNEILGKLKELRNTESYKNLIKKAEESPIEDGE